MKALYFGHARTGQIIQSVLSNRFIELTMVFTDRDEALEKVEREEPHVVLFEFTGSQCYGFISRIRDNIQPPWLIGITTEFAEGTALLMEAIELDGYITTMMDNEIMLSIFDRVMFGKKAFPPNKAYCKEKIG